MINREELHNRRGILLEKTIVCAVIVGIFVLLISGNFLVKKYGVQIMMMHSILHLLLKNIKMKKIVHF